MNFFDNIKKIKNKIDKIDASVGLSSLSFIEIYEKNKQLESEIAKRTLELERANKQMLTLQHVWEMMKSSKSLSNVLSSIISSLQNELGYLDSFILKEKNHLNDSGLQIISKSNDVLTKCISKYFNADIKNINNVNNNLKQNGINQETKFYSTDVNELIESFVPQNKIKLVKKIFERYDVNSYIVLPLISQHEQFGYLYIFSTRSSVNETELTFLKTFAKQIELAITISNLFQTVKTQAITDSMTGLYNRRYFEDFIKKEAIRSDRQNLKFSVIGIDLDYLKNINDVYGHNYGDIAIKLIANVLKCNARNIDVVARMGGEEFNLILPGVDSKGAYIAAERIRKAIESQIVEKIGKITASLGVATYLEHSNDIDELLEIVDRAMYNSKKNGRNRVTIADKENMISWQEIAVNTFLAILSNHNISYNEQFTNDLREKLQGYCVNKERLYHVADALVSTYNPQHVEGIVKQKVNIASLLAKRFDLSKEDIDKLKIAVLLYDIGNIMLPTNILQKTTPLTEEDKFSIRQHPIIAAKEILRPISKVMDIIPIIEKHHENWNGTGYPYQLSGEEIPIESQIILILDSYFALLEKRPYRDAMSINEAINVIKNDIGKKWNDKLAQEFIAIIKNDLE